MPRLGIIDPSSYSEPDLVQIQHADLEWVVDFEQKIIEGSVLFHFRVINGPIKKILLDIRDIEIETVSIKSTVGKIPLKFDIWDEFPEIGSRLTINLPTLVDGKVIILVKYKTSPNASALQWLTAEQTLGKEQPFLFSQCQAIHARSILPCQDTPAVKFTYNASVKHCKKLTALMSAIRLGTSAGVTKFEQKIPIPSYLLAIAVGALVSRDIGPRSKVWAEVEQIEEAAEEFSGTDKFLQVAEEICGPYVWKQYDLLVLPPSFPFGGMENPCLTFVTPTVIAGDKSLVDLIAHEISHSWTGNLVTNMNFEHFWLNEGFTVFVEGKIVGRLHGEEFRDFHSIHGLSELSDAISGQLRNTPELTNLVVDLTDYGPDDAFSKVPYIKGATFLRYLEESLGGPESFEPFLRSYLEHFKFKSVATQNFKEYLIEYFRKDYASVLDTIDWDTWFLGEGMPPVIPKFNTSVADVCRKMANLWSRARSQEIINTPFYQHPLTSSQLIEFLSQLLGKPRIEDLTKTKIELLEKTYKLNETRNSEVRSLFVRICIRARLEERLDEIFEFANSNFRMKFVRPIYRELAAWPEVKSLAIANYEKVKVQMMYVCAYNVAKELGLD